jgi:hypothetical protein
MSDSGWGADSMGAESDTAHKANKPVKTRHPSDNLPVKDVDPASRRQQVDNVKGAIQSLSPNQQREGTNWYRNAHVTAAHVANEMPYGTPNHTDRATAAIARLSPSGGGMDWAKNPQAAKDVIHLNDAQADMVASGNRSPVKNTNLKYASNYDIGKAHAVTHDTNTQPQDTLTTQKIGHFYSNIRHPEGEGSISAEHATRHGDFYNKVDPGGATVDGRADSILKGRHVAWGTPTGLGNQKRYDYESGVYKQAAAETGIKHAHAAQAMAWTAGEMAGRKGGGGHKEHGAPLDYTHLDSSKPVLHSDNATSFEKARSSRGMVPRTVMHPEESPLQTSANQQRMRHGQ